MGLSLDANNAAVLCINAPVAATRAKLFRSFKISIQFVATSAPIIPANTSPLPAVASHG